MLLGDVSRLLGVKPHRIVYVLAARHVPELALRLGNRRVFTSEDIHRIAARLTQQRERKKDD
jgi:DNA-binding transcriptional MerR regulator